MCVCVFYTYIKVWMLTPPHSSSLKQVRLACCLPLLFIYSPFLCFLTLIREGANSSPVLFQVRPCSLPTPPMRFSCMLDCPLLVFCSRNMRMSTQIDQWPNKSLVVYSQDHPRQPGARQEWERVQSGWEDGSVNKVLDLPTQGMGSSPTTHMKKPGLVREAQEFSCQPA